MTAEVQIAEKKEVKKVSMEMDGGVYTLSTIQEQATYAQFLIDKKLVSNTFKDTSQLIVAIQLCKDLSLPMSCLKDFYVIGGRPAIFGDTFVALALGSGVIEDHVVKFYDEDGNHLAVPKKGVKAFSCVVSIRRKGSHLFVDGFYSWDDKQASGNNNENFNKYPNDMLFRRAMGRAIKWACADSIRGIEMSDYAEEAGPLRDIKGDIASNAEKARQLTEKFSQGIVDDDRN